MLSRRGVCAWGQGSQDTLGVGNFGASEESFGARDILIASVSFVGQGLIAAVTKAAAVTRPSAVTEVEGDTYMTSGRAPPARGGTPGAYNLAYQDAQQFCTGKGMRADVIT